VFGRSSAYWSQTADYWGFNFGPYVLIAVFLLLVAFARLRFGKGATRKVLWTKMNLVDGIAPPVYEDQTIRSPRWQRLLEMFLNFL
jgi:hypothetical protein